ncbi:hypothetical protein ALR00_03521 [Pseudomonas savastanoi pv. retacarpa]|nr:hypothetical protein ALR00_03521 [Pseudomonas savastanoi pv. retacarpa]
MGVRMVMESPRLLEKHELAAGILGVINGYLGSPQKTDFKVR